MDYWNLKPSNMLLWKHSYESSKQSYELSSHQPVVGILNMYVFQCLNYQLPKLNPRTSRKSLFSPFVTKLLLVSRWELEFFEYPLLSLFSSNFPINNSLKFSSGRGIEGFRQLWSSIFVSHLPVRGPEPLFSATRRRYNTSLL